MRPPSRTSHSGPCQGLCSHDPAVSGAADVEAQRRGVAAFVEENGSRRMERRRCSIRPRRGLILVPTAFMAAAGTAGGGWRSADAGVSASSAYRASNRVVCVLDIDNVIAVPPPFRRCSPLP